MVHIKRELKQKIFLELVVLTWYKCVFIFRMSVGKHEYYIEYPGIGIGVCVCNAYIYCVSHSNDEPVRAQRAISFTWWQNHSHLISILRMLFIIVLFQVSMETYFVKTWILNLMYQASL